MADLADVFQVVASLPNVPKGGKNAVVERTQECLRHLDRIQPRARIEYDRRLIERGNHHLKKAKAHAQVLRRTDPIRLTKGNEQRVRDFYHRAYYAAFFLARHALVSHSSHDCSIHEEIGTALERHLGGGGVLLRQSLGELKPLRAKADYIMNRGDLDALASHQGIGEIVQRLDVLFRAWG